MERPQARDHGSERKLERSMSARDYYANNRAEIIKRVGEWQKRNPDRVRISKARQRKKVRAEKPYMATLYDAKARARRNGLAFELTESWARERWTGKCELTGALFDRLTGGRPSAFSASLDRIDPTNGYTPDNCRFILWAVNRFKSNYDDATMMRIARLLVWN